MHCSAVCRRSQIKSNLKGKAFEPSLYSTVMCMVLIISFSLCYIGTVRFIGNDFTSAQQLLEALWAYEEWKSEQHIENDADFVARAEELRRHLADSAIATQSAASHTNGEPATASTQQIGSAQESMCVVCMSTARSVVLIPCGHLAVCQSCYTRLQLCPICRSAIRGAIRSYVA